MISDYYKLKKEYESKIKKLQKTCIHKSKSKWMRQWWAFGHSTGYIVRVCNNCEKILNKKNGRIID